MHITPILKARIATVACLATFAVYATAVIQGDYAKGISEYGSAETHMLEMADALSSGLIAAFPEKFRK